MPELPFHALNEHFSFAFHRTYGFNLNISGQLQLLFWYNQYLAALRRHRLRILASDLSSFAVVVIPSIDV